MTDQKKSEPKSVREIVAAWLERHGYDGLCCDDCGCGSDVGELGCCGSVNMSFCVPGYRGVDEDGEPGMFMDKGHDGRQEDEGTVTR